MPGTSKSCGFSESDAPARRRGRRCASNLRRSGGDRQDAGALGHGGSCARGGSSSAGGAADSRPCLQRRAPQSDAPRPCVSRSAGSWWGRRRRRQESRAAASSPVERARSNLGTRRHTSRTDTSRAREGPRCSSEPQVSLPLQALAGATQVRLGDLLGNAPNGRGRGPGDGDGVGPDKGRGLGPGGDDGTGGRPYQIGNGVLPPRVKRSVDPQYTAEAMRAKIRAPSCSRASCSRTAGSPTYGWSGRWIRVLAWI